MVRRNPEGTRAELLQAAFDEMHVNGFQGTGLDQILKRTGVTKGALYHHFSNKHELGYAVLEEVVRPMMMTQFAGIETADDPIEVIRAAMYSAIEDHAEILQSGCPLNNLTQEMSEVDDGFRERIEAILRSWHGMVKRGIERGIETGNVRDDIDPEGVAAFLIATWEGMAGLGKGTRDLELVIRAGKVVEGFLDTLRPHGWMDSSTRISGAPYTGANTGKG